MVNESRICAKLCYDTDHRLFRKKEGKPGWAGIWGAKGEL